MDQLIGATPSWVDRLTLQALASSEAPAISMHLRGLGKFDRYSRFFSAMSDENIDQYVEQLNWSRMIALGLYQADSLIGVAELGWGKNTDPATAEMAVTVDSAYRHRGLAGWLVNETARRGREAGVRQMEASWISGNDAIAKIMRSLSAQIWLDGSHWSGIAELI